MNSTKYNITPFTITTSNTISSISVNVMNIQLNTSATISAQMYDASGNFVKAEIFKMTGTDYDQWGGNDNYVIQYVASQLGSSFTPPA